MVTYTTYGSVRGCCGHKHRTLKTAQECADRDQAGCRTQGSGAYSDREIVLIGDDGYLYYDTGQFAAEDGGDWIRGPAGGGVKFATADGTPASGLARKKSATKKSPRPAAT